jgi:hypothetical protein
MEYLAHKKHFHDEENAMNFTRHTPGMDRKYTPCMIEHWSRFLHWGSEQVTRAAIAGFLFRLPSLGATA